ncbi:MAG: helix-turn-helix domain-containing protein [Gammaproteobacteria bacterium]|nr:helix-turn-helix domain-containing protein [Gammaproteobacteria bacterium]
MRFLPNIPVTNKPLYMYAPNPYKDRQIGIDRENTKNVDALLGLSNRYEFTKDSAYVLCQFQQYFKPSTTTVPKILVYSEDNESKSPAELVHSVRNLSGMTWAQVAEIFGVSSRAVYGWASGRAISSAHHQHLGDVFATLKHIDRGSAEENINLLLSNYHEGRTFFELLKANQCDQVKAIAGKGVNRPPFGKYLTEEAKKYNAPIHFGRSFEQSTNEQDAEITLTQESKAQQIESWEIKHHEGTT